MCDNKIHLANFETASPVYVLMGVVESLNEEWHSFQLTYVAPLRAAIFTMPTGHRSQQCLGRFLSRPGKALFPSSLTFESRSCAFIVCINVSLTLSAFSFSNDRCAVLYLDWAKHYLHLPWPSPSIPALSSFVSTSL